MVPSDKAFERIKLAIVDEYCKFTTGWGTACTLRALNELIAVMNENGAPHAADLIDRIAKAGPR
jgi:hypothetical protein